MFHAQLLVENDVGSQGLEQGHRGLGMPDMEPGLPEGPVAAPAEAGGGTTTQNDGGSAMMA